MTAGSQRPTAVLREIVDEQKRGAARGIYAVCSANRFVLEAVMQQALEDGTRLLVESTSNQVNQYGGYTGMTPAHFVEYLMGIASAAAFPQERLILGGDHLGPNPWQAEPASSSLAKARRLVQDCVQAGYAKIHLDASMRLGDDAPGVPLDKRLAAARAAELCQAAEKAAGDEPEEARPVYVIGTEVPPPGGALIIEEDHLQVTRVEEARETIEMTRSAFAARGLEKAWQRVIAVVVQPGVEFGDEHVFEYRRAQAAPLSRLIESVPGLIYEAHSTDYQRRAALKELVEDHFAILKVGPALTFALREALFALAMIEREWLAGRQSVTLSGLIETVEAVMVNEPRYWESYYRGGEVETRLARKYSFSDRIRYYWPDAYVQRAVGQLLENLDRAPIPLALISQFLPGQYRRQRAGEIENRPAALIYDRIREVAGDYAWACKTS
jgi:D-tagatose-1,6-bisphosphate aldolase subunit GatZ/KbaZ